MEEKSTSKQAKQELDTLLQEEGEEGELEPTCVLTDQGEALDFAKWLLKEMKKESK